MPFFSTKFSPKKTPSRKQDPNSKIGDETNNAEEFGDEIGPIKLKLGDQESVFNDGEWIPETGPVSSKYKENLRLMRIVQHLEDENNMLKLRAELLLDMLAETTAESHFREKEIEKLKNEHLMCANRRKSR